jgi:hypothetical protein
MSKVQIEKKMVENISFVPKRTREEHVLTNIAFHSLCIDYEKARKRAKKLIKSYAECEDIEDAIVEKLNEHIDEWAQLADF